VPGKTELGLIAQEVEEIQISNIVSTDKEGMKSVSYTQLIAPLVKYCQELKNRLEAIENKIK